MAELRDLMTSKHPLIAPSVYDGVSAHLIQEVGFDAAYVGSFATGATRYGLPDVGFIGLSDMADQTGRIADILDVPLIVDGEGGWGNPIHVGRAVRQLERAGAAAVHVEDGDFGKHITNAPQLLPVNQAVDKIKAALDARDSEDLLVIARSDVPGLNGAGPTIDRLLAYEQAGADALFVAGFLRDDEWKRLSEEASVPIVTTNLPGFSAADLADRGAAAVVYYAVATFSATAGMRRAYTMLRDEGSTAALEESEWGGIPGLAAFDSFLGMDDVRAQAKKLGLINE